MIHKIIQYTILAALVFSPLAFGSVEPAAYSLLNLIAIVLFALWSIDWFFCKGPLDMLGIKKHWFLLPVVGFLLLVALQVISLPLALVRLLSPSRVAFLEKMNWGIFGQGPAGSLPSHLTLSIDPYLTSLALVNFACLFLFFLLMLNVLESSKSAVAPTAAENGSAQDSVEQSSYSFYHVLVFTLVGLGFLIALFGIAQKLSGTHEIYWLRKITRYEHIMGPFVNRNHFAGYLEMTFGLTLGLVLFFKRDAGYRLLLAFAALIMGGAIIFSGSRGGVLSLFFQLVCAGIIALSHVWASRSAHDGSGYLGALRRYSIPLAIPVLVIAIILLVSYIGPESILGRFHEKTTGDERLAVWKDTASIGRDFAIVGSGFGTFRSVLPHYQSRDYFYQYLQAHNDYAQLFSETGLLGFALLIVGFGAGLIRGLRKLGAFLKGGPLSKDSERQFINAAKLGALLGIIAICLHSFYDFNLQLPSNALLFLTLCAVLME
jgi:O-antigen ligase